jgi:uncharacterized protein (DUF1800 family)
VPNENYARELQELFTLGVNDLAGQPNYTQDDIVQIARAFTGWRYNSSHIPELDISKHDYESDYPERGPKVIYQTAGGFGIAGKDFTVNGEGAAEIDAVIDIIFQHTDSQGKNTVARRTAYRLLEFLCHDAPLAVDQIAASSSASVDVKALCAHLVHDVPADGVRCAVRRGAKSAGGHRLRVGRCLAAWVKGNP